MGLNRTVSVAAGLAVLLTTALAQATPATAATDSAVTALNTLPNYSGGQATGINDNGTIIGWSTTAGAPQAMRWDTDGTVTELGNIPGYQHSYAYGINKTGTIVGRAYSDGINDHASRWGSDSTVTDLGTLPGATHSGAYGINDNGVIVGYSGIGYSGDHAVRWDANGTITDLNKLPGGTSAAMGINNSGTVIGQIQVASSTGQSVSHAARWAPDGTLTDLGTLPGYQSSTANGINSAGVIVGESYNYNGGGYAFRGHAVRWDPNGTVTDLGTLPSDTLSGALAINDNGLIVGWSSPDGFEHPVLWNSTGVITALPILPNTKFGSANAINYGGTMVGTTDDPPNYYAVRWTQPQLTVTPAVLDFNTVPVGQSVTKTFDVANPGTVPVTITKSIPPTGVFSTSTPVAVGQVLAPGAVLHLSATFTPTNALGASAEWELIGNAGQSAIVFQFTGNTHPIQDYYLSLGGSNSYLGAPVSPVYVTVGGGMWQDYSFGSIYWSPTTGAHAIHGAILDHYKALGGPAGPLGYPTTDETGTPDGIGRYNHFNGSGGASVYWTPQTGAQAIYGAIRQHWAALGWETGPLGYPTSDEFNILGGRRNNFVHGAIEWYAADGSTATIYY